MAFANAGIPVLLKDSEQAATDQAMVTIRRNYDLSVKRGRFSPQQVEERLALIHPQLNYDGFAKADVIIEAVFERPCFSRSRYSALWTRSPGRGLPLASNTSSLDIVEDCASDDETGARDWPPFLQSRQRHAFARDRPRAKCEHGAISKALAIAKKLKKVGVVVGNSPVFVGTEMFLPYMREAQFLTEGHYPLACGSRLSTTGAWPMGIFAVDDIAGIDIGWKVREANKSGQKQGVRAPLVPPDKLYAMGRLGQKTGRGLRYLYGEDRARSGRSQWRR